MYKLSARKTSGPFNSINIEVIPYDDTEFTLASMLHSAEETQDKGAIFLKIPSNLLAVCPDLHQMGYKFNSYVDGVFTFYKWCHPGVEDKVPEFATSIGGVGCLLQSPDMNKVLLVHEYGKWKVITGAVNRGESVVDTAVREVKEEVGIEVDTIIPPMHLGGWQIASARPGNVNDNFHCISLVAQTDAPPKPDGFEIKNAQWFDINFLYKAFHDNSKVSPPAGADLSKLAVDFQGQKFSWVMLQWLGKLTELQHAMKDIPNVVRSGNVTVFV